MGEREMIGEKEILIELVGHTGVAIYIFSVTCTGMLKLRTFGAMASAVLLIYGYLIASLPIMIENAIIIPLELYAIYRMKQLIWQSKKVLAGEEVNDWLKSFAERRPCVAGETVFRAGDHAASMFVVESGRFRLTEFDIEVKNGAIVGEMGFVSPGSARTQTLVCESDGVLQHVSYDTLRELYFQNPKFGFYFLRLVTGRLFENQARLPAAPLMAR